MLRTATKTQLPDTSSIEMKATSTFDPRQNYQAHHQHMLMSPPYIKGSEDEPSEPLMVDLPGIEPRTVAL